METTSEPEPASDIARAPKCSPEITIELNQNKQRYQKFVQPEHNLGRYFSFWASVPFLDNKLVYID